MTAFARMYTCRDCKASVEPHVLRCDYHADQQRRELELAGFDHTKSLNDALALCGLTSRATPTTSATGKRAILRIDGVEVVAELAAHEAWLWLRSGRVPA